jgi:DNA-K related protein
MGDSLSMGYCFPIISALCLSFSSFIGQNGSIFRDALKFSKSPASWLELVNSVKELDEKEAQQIFGEALPPGLILINSDDNTRG